jgi:hypothetical protein
MAADRDEGGFNRTYRGNDRSEYVSNREFDNRDWRDMRRDNRDRGRDWRSRNDRYHNDWYGNRFRQRERFDRDDRR